YHPTFHETYITSRRYGYFAKPGELLTVHCHVIDKRTELRVPVGMVSCYIGGYHVDTLMIEQSGENEPASVTFTFRVPYFISLGEHDLIFEYHGIHGFNPCKQSFAFYVVDKLPTYTTFEDESVYTAGVGEDPLTIHNKVRDYNGVGAEFGEIEYTISDIDDSVLRIDNPIIYYNSEILDPTIPITTIKSVSEETDRYVFELSRMVHSGEIIKLVSRLDVVLDKLLVRYVNGQYRLEHTTDRMNSRTTLRLM
ncbi:MAG: hypothetical protein LUC37_03465, partial [Prevotella sp.]|nr:hypothetical protein [Prevotella sp.]